MSENGSSCQIMVGLYICPVRVEEGLVKKTQHFSAGYSRQVTCDTVVTQRPGKLVLKDCKEFCMIYDELRRKGPAPSVTQQARRSSGAKERDNR